MKGPGMRLDLDVRRLWRCAACQTERHTSGRVTSVNCHFCQDHPPMTLVEPQRADRWPVPPPDLIIELHPDDVDAPAFVPVHLREPEETSAEVPETSDSTTIVVEETIAVAEVSVSTTQSSLPDANPPGTEPEADTTTPAKDAPANDAPVGGTAATTSDPAKKPRRKKKRRRRS